MTYTEVKIKIDELKQLVEKQSGVDSEQLRKLYHTFRLECNYNSNSTEGNTLEKEEVRSLIDGMVHVDHKPLRDLMEIKNHDEVLREMLGGGLVEVHLSEKYIKELHAKLMYEENTESKQALGQWKTINNVMTTYKGDRYAYVGVEDVKGEMRELINRTNEAIDYILKGKKYAPHPIDVALNFHVDFLKISPFEKGNGLMARMLSNQLLIAFVYTPFWITKEENKGYDQYVADILCYEGAKDDLFGHIGQQILRSQQMIVDIQEGKSIEESEKFYNQIELLKRQLKAKEEEQHKVKSENLLATAFAHSIRPLFEEVDQKVRDSFGDLFGEITSSYIIEREEELRDTEEQTIEEQPAESEPTDSEATEELLTESELSEGELTEVEVSEVQLTLDSESISWNGATAICSNLTLEQFKLAENATAIAVDLICVFNEVDYVVDLGNGTVFTKEYADALNANEMKVISDFMCEAIVRKINDL